MAVINTNVKALFSQAALRATERSQQVSMQQLSTGKRINSSRDDAAGMAISTRMTHQIRSLNQAVRNAGDAITLIQTAEGATNEITDMLQRMRELAIQASNDTNNNEQRSYLDLEFQQLKKQIVQIANNTEWNGFPVLNGSTGERVGIKPVYKTTSEPAITTDISVTAGKPTSTSATIRTGGVTETATVTFQGLNAGQTVSLGGLTYTASVTNTATEVAAAFANLAAETDAADIPAAQTTKGSFTGTLTDFGTGANTAGAVTFTSATPSSNINDLVITTTPVIPTVVTTQGVATAVTESAAVVFKDLAVGESVTVSGLTFTANTARTAAQIATAFGSLAAAATGTSDANGTFTGALTGYTSAAAAGSSVTFTTTTASTNVSDIDVTTTSQLAPTVTITQGTPTVTESSVVTFQPLTTGQSVTLNGLEFTATRAVTATEVAYAFGNLAANDTTKAGVDYGTYNGTFTGFTSAAASGTDVTVTSTTATTNVTDVSVGSAPTVPVQVKVQGVSGTVAGVTENSVLTFPAMSRGQTITVAGLTYTATVANSGAEVAAAFANLADGATTGASTLGTYSGTLTSFKSGPSASSTVPFESVTRFSPVTDITVSSGTTVAGGATALLPTVSTPAGAQGATGGGVTLGGSGSFAKAGSLAVVADGASAVRTATFTLNDGQILDLNINNAVTISGGVITINKLALERAGIHILANDNVTLNQWQPNGTTPAAFAAGDVVGLEVSRSMPGLEQMYASDVIINGIPIGASRILDDTTSPQTGNQIASAIAKAAAINEKTVTTGVHAEVNPTIMTGAAMSGTGQARGTLNINGFTTPMINTVLDNPRDSRIAAVNAINFISAQTGVRAVDSLVDSKGIILVADDGRNIEIAFNTGSTDADFSRLTGLSQGVQTGTFSLESMVETPINITSATNGNVHRAGLEIFNYDSKTLTSVTTKTRAAATSADDVKFLGVNDLKINGVAIRAARSEDDTLSNTQTASSKAVASAIATVAAINASTNVTGVSAIALPVKVEGNVTSTERPSAATVASSADGTQSLFINGKNIPVTMTTTQTDDERRAAVVAAIHRNAGLTGVDAVDNGNGGVTLQAVDGRNVSIWFDSNKVDAGSFGLGLGTVTNAPPGVTGVAGGNVLTTTAATAYAGIALQSPKAISVETGDNGFNADADFTNLGFSQGTFGGEVDQAISKMSPPRTGRLAFQVGANEGQKITIDLADFGQGGPITGEITWDADLEPLPPGSDVPAADQGGPNLQGKPLTRSFISSSSAAQDVLKKLDVAMDRVNQTRATMGAVMNRLDHVINNLTNVSMNLSASRSQIEDSDYASASTELAKTQIMQQAATAVLAQANTSQQSVLKLLQG
ncbi:MAG: A-type flagellin [Pseudomonadota bacterium]|jgi:flagellin